jgi:ATP-dependent DNA ligase
VIAEDGPAVFAHACRLGAEGIVSKRVGPVRNPPSLALHWEPSEKRNR